MQRVLDWLKRRGDQNIVSYSRFGLPGEEQEDRPPPTKIHVHPFNENSHEFLVFGTHAQRAAVVSAGIGISVIIFFFLSVFFEFDWYHHERGVDFASIGGMIFFLWFGIYIHWTVIKGIKLGQPVGLIPFIIGYSMLLFVELIVFIFVINHWIALTYVNNIQQREPGAFVAVCITSFMIMAVQSCMLYSVARCRNYMEKKRIHELEMRVVELSQQQHPDIEVVFGPGDVPSTPNIGVLNDSVGGAGPNNGNGVPSAPPTYDETVPRRTILQAEDGLI